MRLDSSEPVEPDLLPNGNEEPAPGPLPDPAAPPSVTTFVALGDNNTSIPPDTQGAVGPNHVTTTLNTQIRIQNKSGGVISTFSLASFWSFLQNPDPFDPKIIFDPYSNRWIFVACADAKSATSSLLVAMSNTSDPTGVWTGYRIDADGQNLIWADFPSLGFNKKWVAVSVNLYTVANNAFSTSRLYLFDKSDMVAGIAVDYSYFQDANGAPSPAVELDSLVDDLYLLQRWSVNPGSLRLRRATGPTNSPTIQLVGYANAPNSWATSGSGNADFAPQSGSAQKIQTNDDRLHNVVYRNGSLWTAHTIFQPAAGPTRSSIQWWQLATDASILQRGLIDDPNSGKFYAFPSIAVNKNNDALIGYSRFSSSQYASANYAFRSGSDPLNTVQADSTFQAGIAPYYKPSVSTNRNRWGDYSSTVVDPTDDTTLWTIQEAADLPAASYDRWFTAWAKVVPASCGPNGTACNDGDSCTVSDTCQNGACVAGPAVTCTAQDQCHIAGTCNPGTGTCSNPMKADGAACNDNNACTQTDTCQAGACTGANPLTCTAQDQCHIAGTCNPGTGTCSNPMKADGAACNDNNACTQTDTCQAGACTGANPLTCTAQDQCHIAGTCNPGTGTCSNPMKADGAACNDNNACTQTDTCQAGACTGANPLTCTAQDQCHTAGTCSPGSGTCSNPPKPDGAPCNDQDACSQIDTCQTGFCTGANPVICLAQDQCHEVGVCDSETGECSNPKKDDGALCNDQDACTQTDTCQSGLCAGENPVKCLAQDQCHEVGTCDSETGECSNPKKDDGTHCSDQDACTQTDTCQSGVCKGEAPVMCSAQDQCHEAGTCDAKTGHCSNPIKADGMSCDDGNPCSLDDVCATGTCAGTPTSCDPIDDCHEAIVCTSGVGCEQQAVLDGTRCADGVCNGGTCINESEDPGSCACRASRGSDKSPAHLPGFVLALLGIAARRRSKIRARCAKTENLA
ncbi:MAG: hypothetical protein IPK82_20055 [Polyangiaceae bacterium]|nr:hypothetical protein [Polyangiaceae bacterium]